MVLISLVLLSSCGKSKFEEQAEQIRNTQINVDQKTLDEVQNGKGK